MDEAAGRVAGAGGRAEPGVLGWESWDRPLRSPTERTHTVFYETAGARRPALPAPGAAAALQRGRHPTRGVCVLGSAPESGHTPSPGCGG